MRVYIISKNTLLRLGATVAALALICVAAIGFSRGGAVPATRSDRKIPVYRVETDEKKIAISFDAAWGAEKTSEIMDILDEYGVRATFFLVGFWVDKYPEKVAEIHERGYELGNHSSTHPKLSTLSAEQILLEVDTCSAKIEALTGFHTVLMRPPFGDYSDTVVGTLRGSGYEVIQWSKDSLDWKNLGVQSMVKQATNGVSPGDIVLFHNNSDYILEALPLILENYRKNGYEVVSVGDILIKGGSYVDQTGVMRASN